MAEIERAQRQVCGGWWTAAPVQASVKCCVAVELRLLLRTKLIAMTTDLPKTLTSKFDGKIPFNVTFFYIHHPIMSVRRAFSMFPYIW